VTGVRKELKAAGGNGFKSTPSRSAEVEEGAGAAPNNCFPNQYLVALLRWNLFTYRDLWKWIDQPFEDASRRTTRSSALIHLGQHAAKNRPTGTPKTQNLTRDPLQISTPPRIADYFGQ
jgi:hypothetical protein